MTCDLNFFTQDYDHYDNTIMIFFSDNGGMWKQGDGNFDFIDDFFLPFNPEGSNFPLRGNKSNIWEGGVRVPAFVHSPLLKKKAQG